MKNIIFGVVGVILVCGLVLFSLRHKPVLFALGGDVRSDRGLQILNPFRSQLPEAPAVKLLEHLKAGECAVALGAIDPDQKRLATICSQEQDYPLTGWRLEAVGDDHGRAVLRYRVIRTVRGKRVNDPFWIWVSKRTASWEVTGYEPWY